MINLDDCIKKAYFRGSFGAKTFKMSTKLIKEESQ